MQDIILVGYGGHAKSIADCIEKKNEYRIIGYTDLEEVNSKYRYLGDDSVLGEYYKAGITNAVVGIGYLGRGNLREQLYKNLKSIGYSFPTIIDPTAIISESAAIDEGVFVGKRAVINAEAKVGKMSIINTGAIIEHECKVGDFAHVAVGAVLCGQVSVGCSTIIGANATVLQCRNVPERCVVPAGSLYR